MTQPYLEIDGITLYHGNSLEVTDWLSADILVTDPPYGRAWRQGRLKDARHADDSHGGIAGDDNTDTRDQALALWGKRPAIVFGDLMLTPPTATNSPSSTASRPTPGHAAPSQDSAATLKRST